MKKNTVQLLVFSCTIILGTTCIAVPNRPTPKSATPSQDARLRNVLGPHNSKPVAATQVQRQEIIPEHYTGITRITDRLGDLIQHVGFPLMSAYGTPSPYLTFASTFILNKHLFIPAGKKVLRWPHSRIPIRHNPLHRDRDILDWLYQATQNTCAHTYNQTAKVAHSFIMPILATAFAVKACPTLIGKY